MTKHLVVFGTGLMAELLFFLLQEELQPVAGFCVDSAYHKADIFCGKPLVSFDTLVEAFPPADNAILVAVGYAGLNAVRGEKIAQCQKFGYDIASYIHPRAVLPRNFAPKPNTIIFENVTVQAFAQIGQGVIIWPGAVVCHHAIIHDNVFIGPGATICGGTVVGDCSLVGAGAVVRDFLTVGAKSIVGAGSVLLRNLPPNSMCNGGESPVTSDCLDKVKLWPPKVLR